MTILTNVRQNKKIQICDFDEIDTQLPIVLALGMFDGIHAGHRALLNETVELADKYNAEPTALTFVNHPFYVLNPSCVPKQLTTFNEKAMLSADCNIKKLIAIPFDNSFAELEPHEFLEKYILQLNVKGIVCGYNYRFGKNAMGDCNYIKDFMLNQGIETCVVDSLCVDGIPVSSTYIRTLIEDGNIELANKFLTSPYMICGQVAHGYHRGTGLGFPTANILPDKIKCLPPNGVYATKTYLDGKKFISVTNTGVNPTYGNSMNTVETHIIDFDGDLYDKFITVEFFSKIRSEKKFSGPNELTDQVRNDIKASIKYFE